MTRLSPNFSLDELTASEAAPRLGIANEPSPEQVDSLRRLCLGILEPVRARFGPLAVSSGYRCPELNRAVGGAETSAHLADRPGRAACDHRPPARGRPAWEALRDEVEWVRGDVRLPFDQVIYEFGRWVHASTAADGEAPRRQALMAFRSAGRTVYLPWDPARLDPATGLLRP